MADDNFERGMRMLDAAVRLGDGLSEQVADHSLRLRRAKRVVESAVRLLEAGRVQAAHDVLTTALAVWEPEK